MNTYFYQNLLLVSPIVGFVWIARLFGFCFLAVHILKLARIGWEAPKTQPSAPPKEEKKEENKAPASQEPIYYIVERKTRRAKSSYKEPKEIRFK